MINYDIPLAPEFHLESVILDRRQVTAPETTLDQLEDEGSAITQSARFHELTNRVLSNNATSDPTVRKSPLEGLLQKQVNLAQKRSAILALPFLCVRFRKKVELKKIELQLDRLEMEILELEELHEGHGDLYADLKSSVKNIQKRLDTLILHQSKD